MSPFFILIYLLISIKLDNDNFETIINSSTKPFLIELYDPWCPHCRAFRSKWENLVNNSKFRDRVLFSDINCNENKKICAKYSKNGYPQVVFIDQNTKQDVVFT